MLSLPLGLQGRAADDVYPLAKRVMRGYVGPGPSAGAGALTTVPKATLLLSAASDWGPRPAILRYVRTSIGLA